MKRVEKYNKISALIFVITGVMFILLNIYAFRLADNFAEKYNAAYYEVDYHSVELPEDRGGLDRERGLVPFDSYFRFYNENGNEVITGVESTQTFEDYNDFNRIIYNLFFTQKFLVVLSFALIIIGTYFSIMRRFNFIGYLIGFIPTILIFVEVTWLNVGAYISAVFLIISGLFVFKSKFIDYNRELFPFIKKRNDV